MIPKQTVDDAMPRRDFLKAGATGLAALSAPAAFAAPAIHTGKPPNVIFLHVDQLSLDAIGAHGCADVSTPNIDRIAESGVTFLQSYSSDPICCPARATWFSGRMPNESGVTSNGKTFRAGMPDLGQWMRNAGYQTFYTGKWHVPGRNVANSFNFLSSGTIGEQGDNNVALTFQGFLKNYRASDPFFMSVGLMNPHDICNWWATHTTFEGEFPYPELLDELPPLPPNFHVKPNEVGPIAERSRKTGQLTANWSDEMWRFYLWSYYRYTEMVDGAIGHMLAAFENSPFADNTVFIFTSDHGDAHIHHRHTQKQLFYDSTCKVPMMAFSPGRIPENTVDRSRLVCSLDIFPTVCDYAGIAPPPQMRGYSLRPALEDRAQSWRDFLVASSGVGNRMIRTNDYKMMRFAGVDDVQLFRPDDDPHEVNELSRGTGRYDETIADLHRTLDAFEARLDVAEKA